MQPDGSKGTSMLYHVFESAFGPCGIAWSGSGLARVLLPDADRDAMAERLQRFGAVAAPDPLPADGARIVAALQRYLAGRAIDFSDFALDLGSATAFYRHVWAAARRIPWGETITYGALAAAVGSPGAARAVGQALGRNPVPIVVPCHRILAGGGRIGGFSAPGGTTTKERLLALEGAECGGEAPLLDLMRRSQERCPRR